MSSNLTRGRQETIDETKIENGKIRLAVDTARMFIDVNDRTRIEITDFVKGLTYAEITALKSPLPKIYLTSDSFQFMIYDPKDEAWKTIGSGGEVATKAIYDSLDQEIISTYIKGIFFDEDGQMLITFGDGQILPIENPWIYSKFEEINNRIDELEKLVKSYTDKIDLDKEKENPDEDSTE